MAELRRIGQSMRRWANVIRARIGGWFGRAGAVVGRVREKAGRGAGGTVALETTVEALCATVDELRARLAEMEHRDRVSAPSDKALSLTLTSRAMVLKLARQGQKPAQIATLLGIPQGEVLLLLKLVRRQGQSRAEETDNAPKPETVISMKDASRALASYREHSGVAMGA
jgi:hypothetical protein